MYQPIGNTLSSVRSYIASCVHYVLVKSPKCRALTRSTIKEISNAFPMHDCYIWGMTESNFL
ncbi:hypothetical protein HYC85_021366 [Camellia sinensis]|uniref:Uncharacterized protein n=1 Tax=Camellia sinensis TaxID=4442 RepID=A0A7J7GHG8_CAMSI|nr:hypothetical protein HYC85_021366 [Camellia sinensis]